MQYCVPGSSITDHQRYHKTIAKPKTPTRQLSLSFTKNYAGKKIVKVVNSFTEIFLNYNYDELIENSDIDHT